MFSKSFEALASLPGAVLGEVFGFVSQLVGAVEKVVKNGLAEKIDASFSVFGRKVGVKAEVFLLDAKGE